MYATTVALISRHLSISYRHLDNICLNSPRKYPIAARTTHRIKSVRSKASAPLSRGMVVLSSDLAVLAMTTACTAEVRLRGSHSYVALFRICASPTQVLSLLAEVLRTRYYYITPRLHSTY